MSHKTAKISLTTIVLVAAFGGLFWSTLSEGTEYYKHVDEVMRAPDQWYGKRQGRRRGRAERHPQSERLRSRHRWRDGQVPVQVRAAQRWSSRRQRRRAISAGEQVLRRADRDTRSAQRRTIPTIPVL
jgi:hypothetical protein